MLVVFLRHAGCTFCRQTLADLAAARPRMEAAGVGVAVVHMSEDSAAASLLRRYGLGDLPRFSDPGRVLYRAFELRRGTLGQLFGPRVWAGGVRAALRGHGVGRLEGDGFQLGGSFVLRGGRIIAAHRNRDAADGADAAAMACGVGA